MNGKLSLFRQGQIIDHLYTRPDGNGYYRRWWLTCFHPDHTRAAPPRPFRTRTGARRARRRWIKKGILP